MNHLTQRGDLIYHMMHIISLVSNYKTIPGQKGDSPLCHVVIVYRYDYSKKTIADKCIL